MIPIQQHLVLVGAGNAHLVFLKRLHMSPAPELAVTLVNETARVPYSAMVPGHIGGDYTWDETTIDLVRLTRACNVRLVTARAIGLDIAQRQVLLDDRAPIAFGVLGLGLGSMPAMRSAAEDVCSWPMRPLSELVDRLDRLETDLRHHSRPLNFCIVGGGASGCELALAIERRFHAMEGFRLTLIQSEPRLVPQFPVRAALALENQLRERGVDLRLGTQVSAASSGQLILSDGQVARTDVTLWATHAAPPSILLATGLPVDAGGFLLVNDHLQSIADPAVFATGDCASLQRHPALIKNGVHAVRQGRVLFDNVFRFLHSRPLRSFRPQKHCLSLMNLANGQALFQYGPLVHQSRLARHLKDKIDRAWIRKFADLLPAAMPGQTATNSRAMRCGGCGSKIGGDVLSAVLRRLNLGSDSRILVGVHQGEDAAVLATQPALFGDRPELLVEVQTVDYFKAFLDDPYTFGRIAAINALSDLYAMNARPFTALAIATLPYAASAIQEATLFELLSGAVRSLGQAGVVLSGGHTTEGAELALGFAVTGHGESDRLFQKKALEPGDLLLLTKPLGSGALLAGWMQARCPAVWLKPLLVSMLQSNATAGRVLADHAVKACTDVTGFGLAGHLLEMLDASLLSATLDPRAVPLFTGFTEMLQGGITSTLHTDNAKLARHVQTSGSAPAWLFDPQTSGGLLAGVKPAQSASTLAALHSAGYSTAAIIGEVLPRSGPSRHIRMLDLG